MAHLRFEFLSPRSLLIDGRVGLLELRFRCTIARLSEVWVNENEANATTPTILGVPPSESSQARLIRNPVVS